MRRVLTFLTSAVLMLASLGVGMFAADLPFWRRAFEWPRRPDGIYLPVAEIGARTAARTVAARKRPRRDPAVDALIVDEAVMRARNAGSRALLVMHRGQPATSSVISARTTPTR